MKNFVQCSYQVLPWNSNLGICFDWVMKKIRSFLYFAAKLGYRISGWSSWAVLNILADAFYRLEICAWDFHFFKYKFGLCNLSLLFQTVSKIWNNNKRQNQNQQLTTLWHIIKSVQYIVLYILWSGARI